MSMMTASESLGCQAVKGVCAVHRGAEVEAERLAERALPRAAEAIADQLGHVGVVFDHEDLDEQPDDWDRGSGCG